MDPTPAGSWFEDLTVGRIIDHARRRTLTESDNVFFSTMTMNPAWLHLDFDYAQKHTEFKQPLVNSLLTLSTLIGISVHETTLGTTVANLGFSTISFPAPMFHGDTLRAQSEVLESRPSRSRPNQGITTFAHRGYNQNDELVVECERAALMLRRPAED